MFTIIIGLLLIRPTNKRFTVASFVYSNYHEFKKTSVQKILLLLQLYSSNATLLLTMAKGLHRCLPEILM